MKKLLVLFLTLALLLGCVPALAAPGDTTLFPAQDDDSNPYTVRSAVSIGDSLYMLCMVSDTENPGHFTTNLYRYDMGQTEPTLLASNLCNATNFDRLDSMQQNAAKLGTDPDKAVGRLFTDGTDLFSFDYLSGKVAKLTFADGQMSYDLICTIDASAFLVTEEDYSYVNAPDNVFYQDGSLYANGYQWQNDQGVRVFYTISLTDGTITTRPFSDDVYYQGITAYKDGLALAYRSSMWDSDRRSSIPAALVTLNLTTLEDTVLYSFAEDDYSSVSNLAYNAAADTLYYLDRNTVYAMSLQGGEPQKVAFVTSSYSDGFVLLSDTHCAAWDSYGVTIRSLDPAYLPTKTLTLANVWDTSLTRKFARENPDIPLIYTDMDANDQTSLAQAMISGSDAVDVITYSYSNGFSNLMKKGYCADLSSSEKLMSFASSMYPALQNAVMQDGKLYAIPVDVYGENFFYNPEVLEQIGLTEADLPTNYIDLCAFITRWNDEWIDDEDKANLLPICTVDIRAALFNLMMNSYIDYYDATNQSLDFDTPLFNELMTALDEMHTDNFIVSDHMTDAEFDEFYQTYSGLFRQDYGMLSSMEGDDAPMPWPLALKDGLEPYVGTETTVVFINPRCANLDDAIRLLESYVDNLYDTTKMMLTTSGAEGIPYRYFDEMIAGWNDELASYEKALETADEASKRDIQDNIDYMKQLLANQDDYRWEVSPETAKLYKERLAEHVFARNDNPLYASGMDTFSQISSLLERFIQKQLPRDQFIKELNKKVRMMVLENQ